jgi:hypothetical protein
MNDGFALGSYGLDDASYTDLVIARWCEITMSPPCSPGAAARAGRLG